MRRLAPKYVILSYRVRQKDRPKLYDRKGPRLKGEGLQGAKLLFPEIYIPTLFVMEILSYYWNSFK